MKKYKKHSVLARLMYGKTTGLIIGLAVCTYVIWMNVLKNAYFGFGMILFYTLLGALIAQAGTMTKHPTLNFKMSWWLRGGILGLVSHLMLVFVSNHEITRLVETFACGSFESPFWILLDGVIIGMFIDWITTKFAGEGEKLPMM